MNFARLFPTQAKACSERRELRGAPYQLTQQIMPRVRRRPMAPSGPSRHSDSFMDTVILGLVVHEAGL
jgi:hypothetical protein